MIGPLEVISESSIGSNLRRVEALTGTATLERLRANEGRLAEMANLLHANPEELVEAIERRLAELRARRRSCAQRGRGPWWPRRERLLPRPGRLVPWSHAGTGSVLMACGNWL